MFNNYLNHWIIGLIGTAVWFWGDKAGIPADAIKYAAVVVPVVVGHALAFTPDVPGLTSPNASAPEPGAPS